MASAAHSATDAANPLVPRPLLQMLAAIVGFSLTVVTVAVLMDGKVESPTVPTDAVAMAEITIIDAEDGSITVQSDQATTVLPSAEHGFIRGTLRAIRRERLRHAVAFDAPLMLVQSGRTGLLSLTDPQTGTIIELRAFGGDNHRVFTAFFADHATPVREGAR